MSQGYHKVITTQEEQIGRFYFYCKEKTFVRRLQLLINRLLHCYALHIDLIFSYYSSNVKTQTHTNTHERAHTTSHNIQTHIYTNTNTMNEP